MVTSDDRIIYSMLYKFLNYLFESTFQMCHRYPLKADKIINLIKILCNVYCKGIINNLFRIYNESRNDIISLDFVGLQIRSFIQSHIHIYQLHFAYLSSQKQQQQQPKSQTQTTTSNINFY